MKLRLRLLLLIALAVSAALIASFWLIAGAVRRQAVRDLERSLQVAQRVFLTLSSAEAENLAGTATSLASEAGFVTVLRTDRATLRDYLQAVQENHPKLQFAMVVDAQGGVLASTGSGQTDAGRADDALLRSALEGSPGSGYWRRADALYLAGAAPIMRHDDFIEGAVLLARRLDQEFLSDMNENLGVGVALLPERGPALGAGLPPSLQSDSAVHVHTLRVPLPAADGQTLAQLLLMRDGNQALAYLHGVRRQLLLLGLVMVLGSSLLAVPILGRVTNPVLQLEKAKAEMDAVFQSSLDGLVALDQAGRIVTANPAAELCLGRPARELSGVPLQELLPREVFRQLVGLSPEAGQRSQLSRWTREGHTFELIRTFVASRHAEIGSVLVTRQLTAEVQKEQRFLVTLRQTAGRLRSALSDSTAAGRLRLERELETLLLQVGEDCQAEPIADLEAELRSLLGELAALGPAEVHVEGAAVPPVKLSRSGLRLLLLYLLEQPGQKLTLIGESGGCWLECSAPPADLPVAATTLTPCQSRLELANGGLGLWLPRWLGDHG